MNVVSMNILGNEINRKPILIDTKFDIHFKSYNLSDVYRESSKELFTVVSTFAGGGGSSTGYRLSGGKILFVNEFIPTAIETYQTNYPDTPVSPEDIRDITSGKTKGIQDWFKSYGVEIGELDILDGSPPCSAFSVSKRLGKGKEIVQSKVQKYSETTQESVGMLIHEYVSIATVSQPKVIVIENVPSIKTSDVFHSAMNRLRKSGYLVNFNVLTSSHFGVSQKRKRLFVIGIREDIGKTVGITDEKDILQLYPAGSNYEPTIKDCLENIEIDERERNFLLTKCRKSSTYEILRHLPVNPNRPLKPENVITGWKGDFNLVRSSWDKPCVTLTQLGQQIGQGGVHHPTENRMFTISELKRLTGLPDDFVLTGTFNQKAERICRMVPPLMIKHLSTSIYKNVLSKL
mgnify:FL=1